MKIKKALPILMAFLSVFSLTGCTLEEIIMGPTKAPNEVVAKTKRDLRVHYFDEVLKIEVELDAILNLDDYVPVIGGYQFMGWFMDSKYCVPVKKPNEFKITGQIDIYARMVEIDTPMPPAPNPGPNPTPTPTPTPTPGPVEPDKPSNITEIAYKTFLESKTYLNRKVDLGEKGEEALVVKLSSEEITVFDEGYVLPQPDGNIMFISFKDLSLYLVNSKHELITKVTDIFLKDALRDGFTYKAIFKLLFLEDYMATPKGSQFLTIDEMVDDKDNVAMKNEGSYAFQSVYGIKTGDKIEKKIAKGLFDISNKRLNLRIDNYLYNIQVTRKFDVNAQKLVKELYNKHVSRTQGY